MEATNFLANCRKTSEIKLVKQLSMRQFEWIPDTAEDAASEDKNINKNKCRKFGQETLPRQCTKMV